MQQVPFQMLGTLALQADRCKLRFSPAICWSNVVVIQRENHSFRVSTYAGACRRRNIRACKDTV